MTDHYRMSKAKGDSAPSSASSPGVSRRVLRIWVVDDNAALSELLVQLLGKQPGLRCTRQFDSAESVLAALAEERPPDVILLDVNLKGMSGLSAIRPIRKAAPSVRVLMMTMFSNGHYEAEAFRCGAAGFLLKSYELAEIAELIQAACFRPATPALFPNMALRKQFDMGVEAKPLGEREPKGRFDLIRALRDFYGATRRSRAA